MNKIISLVLTLTINVNVFSQQNKQQHNLDLNNQSFYFEFFGNSYGIIGINYERIFNLKGSITPILPQGLVSDLIIEVQIRQG